MVCSTSYIINSESNSVWELGGWGYKYGKSLSKVRGLLYTP